MQALHKLQQSFAADIWDENLNRLNGLIMDGRLPAERLFQVYRNNFWISIEDALSEIYGVVKRLVGEQFFSLLVDRYLRRYPPRHGNMHRLGRDLPVFLCDFRPAEGLPYLADVARLEWAFHQVFHAPDVKPFNPGILADVEPGHMTRLRFTLSSSSRIVYSPFPIFEIWRVNQTDYAGDQSVDLDSGGESVLLTRPGLIVELHKLAPADARFLRRLASGGNLGKATQTALDCSPDFDLTGALSRYLSNGTLIADEKLSRCPPESEHAGGKQP
jgi:hypothetical protein